MKIKLVLFDLDGTLIQSTEIIMNSFRETFKKYFNNVDVESVITEFLGQTLSETFGKYTNDNHDINEIIRFYRETSENMIKENLKEYPNAKNTLNGLRQMNIKIGVVTSKMKDVAMQHLEKTGLSKYIEFLVGYEDVEKHKPDPEPINKALNYFNIRNENVIYIGDHENDIISAKKANILSCGVTYSYRIKEILDHNPDFVVDDLKSILDLI